RTPETLPNFLRKLVLGASIGRIRGRKRQVPVLRQLELAIPENCIVARWKFENSAEHSRGIGDPEKSQILVQGFGIQFGLNAGHLQQRLDLRSEGEPVAVVRIIKWLH